MADFQIPIPNGTYTFATFEGGSLKRGDELQIVTDENGNAKMVKVEKEKDNE